MKKAFSPALRKYPALILFLGVASAWLLSSCGLLGKDLSSVKDWITGKDWSSEKQAQTYYESGVRDFQSGALQVAIDEFSKAIQLNPSFAAAYQARAALRFQKKDYADALADCDKVIGLRHDDEHIYLIKGACHFFLQDFKGARNILSTAIAINPDDPLAWECRGEALGQLRDWDEAVADFTKAIQLNPDDTRAYYGRAVAESFLKEYEKSLADASDAIQLLDDTVTPDAYGVRAVVKSHLKDRAGAFADANTKIQLNKSDDKGYLARAGIETMWDDYSDASNDLQTAFQINPTNSEIYLCRGAMEQKCGNFPAALADYSRGKLDDTEAFKAADVYESMGYVQAEMGKWEPALNAFRMAMAFSSTPHDITFEVFLIECRLGQTKQAKKELAAYILSIPPAKVHDWPTIEAHYLAGTLNETDFISLAASTAKRPTDIAMQTGDAWYYSGMVHLLAGDRADASDRFKKCLKVGDDNSNEYTMAQSLVGF
jgi:tetratricopeptide (TPR) repeat protein